MADPAADARWMLRAIDLAQKGYPAPNPHVGCVIVRDGQVVGEGYHDHAGGPHAEAVALAQAGQQAHGADAYVTLEPCDHQGRTPPCSLALIQAGVRRVVFAVPDPDPTAKGGGKRLLGAGVVVEQGLLESEAREAARQFLFSRRHGRPLVGLKVAMSLDGRVGWPDGRSKWVTGEEARAAGRLLRAEYGAVLVGVGTVLADDPALTARDERVVNEPLRVVLDPNGRLTGSEKVFQGPGECLWCVREATRPGQHALASFDPWDVARHLGGRGITGLMVEGGPHTWRRFLEAGLADQLEVFLAPVVVGAGEAWAGGGTGWPPDSLRWKRQSTAEVGDDLWLRFRRPEGPGTEHLPG